jgi:hypothetical protein
MSYMILKNKKNAVKVSTKAHYDISRLYNPLRDTEVSLYGFSVSLKIFTK